MDHFLVFVFRRQNYTVGERVPVERIGIEKRKKLKENEQLLHPTKILQATNSEALCASGNTNQLETIFTFAYFQS